MVCSALLSVDSALPVVLVNSIDTRGSNAAPRLAALYSGMQFGNWDRDLQMSGPVSATIRDMHDSGSGGHLISPDPLTAERRLSIFWVRPDKRRVSASNHSVQGTGGSGHVVLATLVATDGSLIRVSGPSYSSSTIAEPFILGRPMF